MFSFGTKPGILVKKENYYQAFIAVCTHLSSTVTFLSKKKMFYCACHNGWYDENGVNVAGPPPSPLKQLIVTIEGGNVIIHKELPPEHKSCVLAETAYACGLGMDGIYILISKGGSHEIWET